MNKNQLKPHLYKTYLELKKLKVGNSVEGITRANLGLILDRNPSTVTRYFRQLEKLGFIDTQIEGGRNGKTKDGEPRKLIITFLK